MCETPDDIVLFASCATYHCSIYKMYTALNGFNMSSVLCLHFVGDTLQNSRYTLCMHRALYSHTQPESDSPGKVLYLVNAM